MIVPHTHSPCDTKKCFSDYFDVQSRIHCRIWKCEILLLRHYPHPFLTSTISKAKWKSISPGFNWQIYWKSDSCFRGDEKSYTDGRLSWMDWIYSDNATLHGPLPPPCNYSTAMLLPLRVHWTSIPHWESARGRALHYVTLKARCTKNVNKTRPVLADLSRRYVHTPIRR